jgi:hypothetical protein
MVALGSNETAGAERWLSDAGLRFGAASLSGRSVNLAKGAAVLQRAIETPQPRTPCLTGRQFQGG